MTEAEWLSSDDPSPMLEFLNGEASERKLRLFAVACCRRNGHFVESWYHRLADVIEQFADGHVTEAEVKAACSAADDPDWVAGRAFQEAAFLHANDAIEATTSAVDDAAVAGADHLVRKIRRASHDADSSVEPETDHPWIAAMISERAFQAKLLRDVFGNLFNTVTSDPTCVRPALLSVAQSIYDGRTFERMTELGDALEAAGCTNDEILEHCRGPGPHVRACWVVDLILGKG